MSVIRANPTPRGAGHLLRAAVAAWLLVLALVVPAGAVEGPTRLFDPSVSPTSATPTTTITLTVEYRNREGSAPAYVRVVIDGTAHDMTGDGGADWKQGVGHHYSTRLPSGTHEVSFVAADTRKFSDAVSGGTITVSVAPAPKPAPTPPPAPAPNPDPTPAPAPTGSSGGTDGTGGSDPTAGVGLGGGIAPNGTGDTAIDPDADGPVRTRPYVLHDDAPEETGGPGSDPEEGRIATAGAGPLSGGGPGGPGAGPDGPAGQEPTGGQGPNGGAGGSTGGDQTWGALAATLDVLGVDTGTTTLTVLPTLVGTSGAVAMALAFAIFGKKRRDEEPPAPDEVLQANAARGGTAPASGGLVGGVVAVAAMPAPIDLEASMPRWRRPSLQEARKADPTRSVSAIPKLRFADEDGSAIGYERRLIRYRVVRLLDAPDELRSVEIGQLDQGDEVQLLEKSGAYWLVRTPDGRQGWLHKMTLGETVGDASASEADAWNVGDIDGDVLSAYLAARARA